MDKTKLTTLVNHPAELQEKDFEELLNLKVEFPYFQALYPLITIASKQYAPQSEKKHLQTAALYTLDRKHLKAFLTKKHDSSTPEIIKKEPEQEIVIKTKQEESNKQVLPKTANRVIQSPAIKLESLPAAPKQLPDSFFEELFSEMEALKVEKENYYKTLEKFEGEKKAKPTTKAKTTKKTTAKTATTKKPVAKAKKPTTTKAASKKKAVTEKAKDSGKKTANSETKKTAKPTKTTEKKTKKVEHDIIEQISSRKELKISDVHKKEQLDIINSFIEKEPQLTKRLSTDNQSSKQEAEDLSASSTNLSDDVVSETLAKLMIKQNRKEKAIDIYKKLIWRFPQKKTYFVEIIDELKKES